MEHWMHRPAWVEIDLRVLDNNIKLVNSRIAEGSAMLAVVKGNCYGHGLRECYPVFKANGVSNFAVATLDEAIELREIGDASDRIVLMGLNPAFFADVACEYNVVTLVKDLAYAKALSQEACRQGKTVEVMGVVDTGMGRIGYQWDDPAAVEELAEAAGYPGLNMIGIFSHFSSEDMPDRYWSRQQLERFEYVLQQFQEKKGMTFPLNSLANSPATSHNPKAHFGLCRPGGSLYGRYQGGFNRLEGVEAVMTVKALVTQVKEVPDNFSVSYMRSGRTSRPSRIATLPLGYGDGFPRSWGNGKGYVLIGGRRAPIIGVICMDQFMIDVTDLPDVREGDEAVLIGKSGDETIVLGDIGKACGILSNEVSLNLQLRLPYKYMV